MEKSKVVNIILRVTAVLLILCFFGPFTTVSCSDVNIATVNGWEMTTGKLSESSMHNNEATNYVESNATKVNAFLIIALIGAIIVIVLGIEAGQLIGGIVSIVGLLLYQITFKSYYFHSVIYKKDGVIGEMAKEITNQVTIRTEWGLLLSIAFSVSIVGMAIYRIYLSKKEAFYSSIHTDDYSEKLHRLNFEQSIINHSETSEGVITLNTGEWICPNCKKVNASYVGTCGCGTSRRDNKPKSQDKEESGNSDIKTDSSENSITNRSETSRGVVVLKTGEWICPNCKKVNASYVGTCGCGVSRRDSKPKKQEVEEPKKPAIKTDSLQIIDPVQRIKEYKELLDIGAITQDEYDKKKEELLKL